MDIEVKNKYFYFGKVPLEYQDDMYGESPEGWESGWYFRLVIDTRNEQVNVEDSAGRMVPIDFVSLYDFLNVLGKVQNELITSVVGAPNTNA